MIILISFCNQTKDKAAYNLLMLDTENGRGEYLLETNDGFTGLAQDSDYIYALSQNSNAEIIIFDKKRKGIVLRQKMESLIEPHSLAVTGNLIFAVSTGKDCVLQYVFDRNKMTIILEKTVWMPHNSTGENDTHHINSILYYENNLYVSAFGLKKNERWHSAESGYIFNITENMMVITNIYHPHSVFVTGGTNSRKDIFYCESSTRSVKHNNHEILKLKSGYVRGLSLDDKYLILGTSSGRRASRNTGLVNNPADPGILECDCRVLMFKKRSSGSYDQIKEFSFIPMHNEIYDIMKIS